MRVKPSALAQMGSIIVDGQPRIVRNRLSSGPDAPVHTFELAGGSYVYEIAGIWFLQDRGQFAREVTLCASK